MATKRYYEEDKRMHKSSRKPDNEYLMEKDDAGMIHSDYTKMANLPQDVMMKPYPKCPAYMDWEMEDNIKGIDRQLENDNARRRSGFDPHKY
jgi:hypothetical protein